MPERNLGMETYAHSDLTIDAFQTLACGLGQPAGCSEPLVTAIVQSTTFTRAGTDDDAPHQYSRVSNPTVSVLESALGRLEDAPDAVCFASGLAAETALFLALVKAGDKVVCGRSVYGGTTRLLRDLLEPLGVETVFVDASDALAIEGAVDARTRVVFVETPANPTLELTDIRAAARAAKRVGAKLVVDNTFLTAVVQRPLDLGGDVSVYSTTKFIEGHSAAPGGAVVSRDEAVLERVRWVRKSTGAIQSPLHAWITLQGVKTLPLRFERQSRTAAEVARELAGLGSLRRVLHPSLEGFGQKRLAREQHQGGLHGAVVTIELDEEACDVRAFLGALRLCRLVEHVGSVETLVTHPATMTHADVPALQRRAAGLTDGLVRISVGLESSAAIAGDLSRALAVSRGGAARPSSSRGCVPAGSSA